MWRGVISRLMHNVCVDTAPVFLDLFFCGPLSLNRDLPILCLYVSHLRKNVIRDFKYMTLENERADESRLYQWKVTSSAHAPFVDIWKCWQKEASYFDIDANRTMLDIREMHETRMTERLRYNEQKQTEEINSMWLKFKWTLLSC